MNEPARPIDPEKLRELKTSVRSRQSLTLGALGAVGGSILGILVWGVVSASYDRELSMMALIVGLFVGIGMRILGRGIDLRFSLAAAVWAALASVVGNVIGYSAALAGVDDQSFLDALRTTLRPELLEPWLRARLTSNLGIYCVVSAFLAYRLSFRRWRVRELARLVKDSSSS
jgi:hypothetical protein